MNNYYRNDYKTHQTSYRRMQQFRRGLRLVRTGGAALALAGLVALLALAWVSLGPGWVQARLGALGLFRIETLRVAGNSTLSEDAVLAAAGLRAGESLIGLDLGRARARLLGNPWVREASLRRRLPGTLVVEIVERVPCIVVRADRDYLVDATGTIAAAVDTGAGGGLPVLTGVAAAAGALTARGAIDVADGIALIEAIRQVGFPALAAIDHVDLGDPDDAVIVPVGGRPLVHAGRGDALLRLHRWRLVAPDMARRWPELEYVDLRSEGQVVAMPAAPAPAPAVPDGAAAPPQGSAPKPGTGGGPGQTAAGGGDA